MERDDELKELRMGLQQEVETLISEEAFLFAQYLRNERQSWIPRVVGITD